MSPTRRQTKRDKQKHHIFAPTVGARSSIALKLCMVIDNFETIKNVSIIFRPKRIFFTTGAKMLILATGALS